jgi:hypothetical protein
MRRRTKRKVKKFFIKNELMLFVVLIAGALFSVTTAYSIMSKQVEVTGTGEITGEFASSGGTCPFEMTYQVTGSWGNFSMVNLNVKNISEWQWKSYVLTLSNMDLLNSFYGPFRSQTSTDNGKTYLLFPQSYLLPLNAGETRTFQLQVETTSPLDEIFNTLDVPNCGRDNPYGKQIMNGGASLRLNKYEKELPTSVQMHMANMWNGHHYKVSITNNTNQDIYDWRMIIYFNGEQYVETYGHNGIELLIENSQVIGNGISTLSANSTIEFFVVLNTREDYLPDVIGAGSQPNI